MDEQRLGRVERETSVLETRMTAVERELRALVPLATSYVRLESTVQGVKEDVQDIKQQITQRGEAERSLRIALIGLTGTILVVLLGAIITLVTTGGHP